MSDTPGWIARAEARRTEVSDRRLPPWMIAAYELVVTMAVLGTAGMDIWLQDHIRGAGYGLVDLLRSMGDLGNSKWSIVAGSCLLVAALILRWFSDNELRRQIWAWIASAAAFMIASVAISGILLKPLKILYGRARPKFLEDGLNADWTFVSFDWSHQSFPSGHATTMFALALVFCFFWPRLRSLWVTIAVAGALARVATANHFLSDVVAGAAFGAAFTWWLRGWFARHNWVFEHAADGRIVIQTLGRNLLERPVATLFRDRAPTGSADAAVPRTPLTRYARICLVAGFLLAPIAMFTPLDRWVADLFFMGGKEFWLTRSWVGDAFHDVLRPMFYWVLIVLVLGLSINGMRRKWRRGLTARRLLYILLVMGLGVGLLTNVILKDQWDRPRPLHTVEFGGKVPYRAPILPAEGCDRNCSFVSGDAAAAFAMIALPIAFATGRRRRRLMRVALWFGVVIGLMRMMNGSHFLFDVTYAGIFNVLIAVALYPAILKFRRRTPRAIWHWFRTGLSTTGSILRQFWHSCRHPQSLETRQDVIAKTDSKQ